MTVTVTNLLQGPANLFHGLTTLTDPAFADDDLTAIVGLRDLGGTDGGATATIQQTYTPMTVDQIAMPVGARKTEMSIAVATSLAEATLDNLRAALNDTGTGDEIEIDANIANVEPTYSKVILQGMAAGGAGPRLIVVRRCLSTESIGMSWTKDGKTMIPVTFTGYYVSASIFPVKITDKLNPAP